LIFQRPDHRLSAWRFPRPKTTRTRSIQVRLLSARVVVWFFISEDGTVLDSRVSEPGQSRPGLDSASDYFPDSV